MSSKVKQANFRLPLEYMSMIDDFASRENITKAAVITRALDCMQASYDSGNGGMPVTGSGSGASEQEINDLKNQLKQAEERAQAAEQRANDAVMARDAAEAKARDTATPRRSSRPSRPRPALRLPFRRSLPLPIPPSSIVSKSSSPSRKPASRRRPRRWQPRRPRSQPRRPSLQSVMRASRLSASSSVRQTPRLNSHPPLRS